MKEALIIFTKNPEKGKVKTRLAETVGDDNALIIYQALLHHTAKIATDVPVDRFAFYSNEIGDDTYFHSDFFHKEIQFGEDLGAKMYHAAKTMKDKGYEQIVIIGSDCHQLNGTIISQAFETLKKNDFVFGPALDGGYYLVGMKQVLPSLFLNKEWSTETVLEEAIATIIEANLSYETLTSLSDVDYENDLGPLKELIQ